MLKKTLLSVCVGFSLVNLCFADFHQNLLRLEASSGGKIGLAAVDTTYNTHLYYRGNERFPFCSTFKVIGVSAVLKKSMTDKTLFQQRITYKKNEDIIPHSPETEKHLADGMTVTELCAAAMTQSDNAAINLLMNKIGGLEVVNDFARSIGDKEFRLDRWEIDLNTAIPKDVRDTTTPIAMQESLQKLALGKELEDSQRELLQTWLKNNTTGNLKIRAGVPKGWVVGDKTGTGDYGTSNDIGIIWPKGCKPIVLVVYFTQNKKDAKPRNDVIASATKLVIDEFARSNKCIINHNY